MILQLTFKTPDVLNLASERYADGMLVVSDESFLDECGLNLQYFREDKIKEFKEIASKWIEYGELITVEIDTELNTCKVV